MVNLDGNQIQAETETDPLQTQASSNQKQEIFNNVPHKIPKFLQSNPKIVLVTIGVLILFVLLLLTVVVIIAVRCRCTDKQPSAWKQYAQTIAGGNAKGDKLSQFNWPQGIYIDDQQQTIYIADHFNHRIVKWKLDGGSSEGQIVAGGNGEGNEINQLNGPTDVTVDQNRKSLIICDEGNRRIVRWSLENSNDAKGIIIENIDCYGLAMNENGDLFVSDKLDRVKRWRKGEKEGTIVAGGNGKGNQVNQLNIPTFIFIDRHDTLYVSDTLNHRVMKWMKGAKEGVVVAGGQGQGSSLKQLQNPHGLFVSKVGDVYVADSVNVRIMRWSPGSEEGRIIVGGNGEGEGSNQFNHTSGLSFDVENNIYVVDAWNYRVQRFNLDKKTSG